MLKNLWRCALRNLTRNAATSGLNILGLAVGMTAAILIFLWVDNELTFDSYHPDASRIYRVTAHVNAAGWIWATTPPPMAAAIRTTIPQAEIVTSVVPGYNTFLRNGNELVREQNSAFIDSNWFDVFHYTVVSGSIANFLRNPYSLILTESKAKAYFGNKDPIGRLIHKDTLDYRVAAVIRDNPANSSFRFDILIPMQALMLNPIRRGQLREWGGYSFTTFVKLQPDANPARTAGLITGILRKNRPEDNRNYFTLTPLQNMHLETGVGKAFITHGDRTSVYIFSILGAFVLLIACINYVNLTTANASRRAREVGIRKLIGAAKRGLFTQFLFESTGIGMLSLAVTVGLLPLVMPFFRDLTGTDFPQPLASPQTWNIIGFTLLIATLLNGIYPAILLSSFKPLAVLKGRLSANLKDRTLRRGLVVLQFTFSILLIACTGIIQKQLAYIRHSNPGYDRSQLFYFTLPTSVFKDKTDAEQSALCNTIKGQLLAHTAITGVTMASEPIVDVSNGSSGGADWEGHDTAFIPTIYQLSVDEDFKDLLQLQLLQGRWFDPRRSTDEKNFVINETAISNLGLHRPVLNQWFVFQGDTGRIIGVVKDFHFASLHDRIEPLLLFNHPNTQTALYVKTRAGQTAAALAATHSIWESYVNQRPFEYSFLDDDFNALYQTDTKVSTLIITFSGMAILISCLGLLGLAAFTAQQRIREIGIRKVLGATTTSIVTLLSADFARLVLLAAFLATPIAWFAMHRWLDNFAYHIRLGPWPFIAAGGLATGIALLTIASQSLRAARTNPVKNLRTE